MPYRSKAQAAYMHAQHPEIAAKWDEEHHAAKKQGKIKKLPQHVSKSKRDLAAGLGVAAVGGAAANQIPPVQQVMANRKKKAKIKKMQVPVSDDPFFNQAAAQKTFDLIMKMDDDTAEVFCHVVASDLLEQEVERNRVTLQKHLDHVVAKRLADLKRATLRAVSKGAEDPIPFAQALAVIDSAISKANNDIPDWEFERKIRRDPSSGRFQTKFTDRGLDKPMPDKTAKAMGILGTTGKTYGDLKPRDKARYQNQYLQIKNYLNAVNVATGNEAKTLIHFKDDETGETWAEEATSTRPPTTMLPANVRAIGAESSPTALTVGGAAFSLAGAAGHAMDADQVKRIEAASGKTGDWKTDWLKDEDAQNANARLYRRTATLGEAASTLGAPGSKTQLAGKMAEIVGQYGPQAEEVLGPTARKTAYRYRGTERTPDQRLISLYSQAINENKRLGPVDPWAEQEENKIRTARGAGKQPFGTEAGVRPKGSSRRQAKPETTPSLTQMVADRESRANRAPEWQERELGRNAVTQYLTEQLPSKETYKLQLASGNTPPSEGVIINADGQIVTQAVGYGDDHYLPFNLKNLKGLKGGEYIRNRSVGGLTAEDVYTGLISGARRVTVVSRSGTYTMEFKPDFRGGRRHNDKARRMTRRYEQILDAVQSEQVERKDVPHKWKKIIEEEVRAEYGPNASQRLIRAEVDARQKEFKANPQVDGRDLDRAEAAISRFEEQAARGEVPRQDAADFRRVTMNELRDLKEIHFRLNGVGYTAALEALQEQFPYYINAQGRPKDEDLVELEQDQGYVEPARNRPTAASAGWYGTAARGKSGAEGRGGKFSAAHADYQRGMPGAPEPARKPGSKEEVTETPTTSSGGFSGGGSLQRTDRERNRDKAAEALEAMEATDRIKSTAVGLQQAVRGHKPPSQYPPPPWWDFDRNRMQEYVEDEENLKKFNTYVNQISDDTWNETSAGRQWQQYKDSRDRSGGSTEYSSKHATNWLSTPYKFTGDSREAYRPSPDPVAIEMEIKRLDGDDASLVFAKPLSELTPEEMKKEFDTSRRVALVMKQNPSMKGDAAQDALGAQFPYSGAFHSRFFKEGGAEQHLENIHRMRYLRRKQGPGGQSGGPQASGGQWRGTPGQPSGGGAGVSATPPQGGGGGHLVRMEETPEDAKANAAQIEDTRKNWVGAAQKVLNTSTDQDEHNDLGVFIAGMEAARGDARGYKRHDEWLDDLTPELRQKVESQLQGAPR